MYNDKKIKDKIVRRVILLGGIQITLFSLIFGRLYKLQVVDNQKYKMQSDKNRISFVFHAPIRGNILDSSGYILAKNKEIYSLYLIPLIISNMDKVIRDIAKIILLSKEDIDKFLNKVEESQRKDKSILLKNNLSWNELSILSVNKKDIPGMNIKVDFIREYSKGLYYSHIIGYTFKDTNKKDLIIDMQYGKMGIEKSYDNYLKGIPGAEETEVNANGNFVRRLSIKKSTPGSNIQLTINTDLQQYAYKRMGSEIGASLVLDAENGNILASASSPSFDPNIFSNILKPEKWDKIIKDKNSPLINRSFKGLYPPGSTFKPVIAIAALKYKVINKNEKIFCNGIYSLGNRNFHCWKKNGHGNLDLESAISESCDVYFYELALRLGIEKISDMAKSLGFGNYYNEYFGKSYGIIPNKKWKREVYKEKWQKGETLNVGIGQGFLLVTPLELALMTANIVNMENIIRPNIIKSIDGNEVNNNLKINSKYDFNKEHLSIVKKAMFQVVNSPKGTAWKSRINDSNFKISGKTGTSQVRIISKKEREDGIIKNKDLPWEKRDHALFIGFAPYDKPKFVTAIILEHAGGGSQYAAPVGKDLLIAARRYISGIETKNENEV